jgi:hypothetical protein
MPPGLAFGPGELLYVADHANHRIAVFGADGAFVRTLGRHGSPTTLCFGKTRLLLADQGNHRIQLFQREQDLFDTAIRQVIVETHDDTLVLTRLTRSLSSCVTPGSTMYGRKPRFTCSVFVTGDAKGSLTNRVYSVPLPILLTTIRRRL